MELKKVWMSPGDREEKPIWVSGGWRYSWNCVSDDSVAFYRNVSVSFFWIAPAKFFYDSGTFCHCPEYRAGGTYGISGNAGCHNFFSDRK